MDVKRLSNRRKGRSTEFQPLNLIPIMNLFITIIPMLLIITVTVHLTMLSLNLIASQQVEGGEGEGSGGRAQELRILLVIYPDRFEIHEGTLEPLKIPVIEHPNGSIRYDYYALDAALRERKETHQDLFVISVSPLDDVLYDTLVRAIDVCKHTGFTEVKYERIRVAQIK